MLVLLTGIFLSGCIIDTSSDLSEKKYFDLKNYFNTQAGELNQQNITMEKLLINNKDTQKVVINNPDWNVEFTPFINSDINKPALRDSYKIDSVFKNNKLNLVKYISLDEKQSVSQIQLHISENKIDHVFIENSTSNYVYNSARILSYTPFKGYTIEGEQDIILGSDLHYKIDVRFIK